MIKSRTSLLFIINLCLFLVLVSPSALSQEPHKDGPGGEDWIVVKSSYADIFVDRDTDLKDLAEQLDVGFARYDPFEKRFFLDKAISDAGHLANKIDIIIRKAKKILDMHPEGFHVNIRIYETDRDLWNIYEKIFKERKEYKAFYIHKFRTVYISLDNVSESVLAHEIGHSIIDSYFDILPPQKIRELLACYVDVHLKD